MNLNEFRRADLRGRLRRNALVSFPVIVQKPDFSIVKMTISKKKLTTRYAILYHK